jgi:hypothetical protein
MDFIPLVTDNERIAFCQATASLCDDVQRIIWDMYLKNIEPECPPAPQKIRAFIRDKEFVY